MEPVAANAVVDEPRLGHGVAVGSRRQGSVKGGVEHGHLRHRRPVRSGRLDPGDVGRIVQRGERHQRSYRGDDVVVDERRLGEHLPTVHHPVAHRFDRLAEALAQPVDDGDHLGQGRRVVDDLLDDTAGKAFAGVGVDQLVLHRRAAGVQNEHPHCRPSLNRSPNRRPGRLRPARR